MTAPRACAAVSPTGVLFAAMGLAALALPFVQVRPNRIVPGEGAALPAALGPAGGALCLAAAALLLVGLRPRASWWGIASGLAGAAGSLLVLGAAARQHVPDGNALVRVAPASGFWLLLLSFSLAATDCLARLRPPLRQRWLLLAGVSAGLGALLGSGALDEVSIMREFAARAAPFQRETLRHLLLVFGSLGAALAVGLPLGVLVHQRPRTGRGVMGVLNIVQTIPSLALFGVMIPVLGWVAARVPAAAAAGIAGIGAFPALVALFLYSLLPVVSNTAAGLSGVPAEARDAARGLGMTRGQVLAQVSIPLAVPAILAGVRIVLVQNIGLAVIAGLIGGGGYGTFVFQGLNQTAMDLILLGALPTIAMALAAGIALGLVVEWLDRRPAGRGAP